MARVSSTEQIREQLIVLGTERAAARQRAVELSRDIAPLAHQAVDAGIPKIEIARLAQISRTALDTMLES